MLPSGSPSNEEIRGDWSNLKGTDYHLVYVVWLLLRGRASHVAFYRGNDLLATPIPPARLRDSEELPVMTMFAHQVEDADDLWIQLKSSTDSWSVSELLSGNLLANFIVNAFTSTAAGRRWRAELVTQGHVQATQLRAFLADPSQNPHNLKKFEACIAAAAEAIATSCGQLAPSGTELAELGWQVLTQLADTSPKSLGELRAEVETEIALAVPDRRAIATIGDTLHGALLRDSAQGPAQAHVYDVKWINDAAGRQVVGVGLFDTDPPFACTRANERACPRDWEPALFVQRGLHSAVLDDFLREHQTLLALVGPSGSGKSWMLAHWAQVHLAGQIRLLIKGTELTTPQKLQRLVGDALSPETTVETSDWAVLRKLTAAARATPVLLVDNLVPSSGVDTLREALEQLVSDCVGAGWKLVVSCSDVLWRLLRGNQQFASTELYQGSNTEGSGNQLSTALQPLSDDELREFLHRRLEPTCAESTWHKLRESRFRPLRGPYLLERYVERHRAQLCSDTVAPLPGMQELLTSRLEDLIGTVARRHNLASSDVAPALDALAIAIQRARPAGLSYAEARRLFEDSVGVVGASIIADLRQLGVITAEGPVDFAEEPLGRLLLFRRFGQSTDEFRTVLPKLIPERDAGFVEMTFAHLGEAAAPLAEELLSHDSRWGDALPSAFVQVSPKTAGLQVVASLAALDNRRKRMMVALEGTRAIGELATSNALAMEWLLRWYLSERPDERHAGEHGLHQVMRAAPRRVGAAMRLRLARARSQAGTAERKERYLRGALSPLLGIANTDGARIAQGVLERCLGVAAAEASAQDRLYAYVVDEVRGAIALYSGGLDQIASSLSEQDPTVRLSAARAAYAVALDAPEAIAPSLCQALKSESDPTVRNELSWSAHGIIRTSPERLLQILEGDGRYFDSASLGYTLVLLSQLAARFPERVERLLPASLASLPPEHQAFLGEIHAYAWWRLAQRVRRLRPILDQLATRNVDHIPPSSRMLARRGNLLAKLGALALDSIPGELFETDSDAWPLVYAAGDRKSHPPLVETSGFCRRFTDRLRQHPEVALLRDQIVECLIDADGGGTNLPPWSETARARHACALQCLEMLSELVRFDRDALHVLERLQADWYGLFLASELLESGVRDESVVAYATKASAATAHSISVNGTEQRERCMAALAAMHALDTDAVVALEQHRADFGNTYFADSARSRALAELGSRHLRRALALLEQSIMDEDDLGTLFTLTETARTWWQYLIAKPYTRMFHPRRISLSEARGLCEEMLTGLRGLPPSDEQSEHLAVYEAVLTRLNGNTGSLPRLSPRPGLIGESHDLALRVLNRVDAGLDADDLERLLYDRRGWLHSLNRGIGDWHLSVGSGVYLLYVFPAVRLASIVAGRRIGGLPDPGSDFMRSRIEGQRLVYSTESRLRYLRDPTREQLHGLLEPLLQFVEASALDERVWSLVGDLKLRLGDYPGAYDALARALSYDWSDRLTRAAATYDLACTNARLGREEECRRSLTDWSNMVTDEARRKHVLADADLKSVNELPWFKTLFG